MNFKERRMQLLQRQQQLTANLGYVQGQLALLDEMEFGVAPEVVQPPPAKTEEVGNGKLSEVPPDGEAWDECGICGNYFPKSQMRPHYRKGFMVDRLCDDERTHADNMELVERGNERGEPTDQRVPGQGEE